MNYGFYFHGLKWNQWVNFQEIEYINGNLRFNGKPIIQIDFRGNKYSIAGLFSCNKEIFNAYIKYLEKIK
jgi:hypothetical protein